MTAEPQTLRGALPVPAEVRAYLDQFEELASLVPEVCAALRAEFGDEAELSLELYTDPEFADRYLTLYVRQAAYDRDMLERIDRACTSVEDRLDTASGRLLVTTDFRPPRGNHAV
jgi:hypothetical protein